VGSAGTMCSRLRASRYARPLHNYGPSPSIYINLIQVTWLLSGSLLDTYFSLFVSSCACLCADIQGEHDGQDPCSCPRLSSRGIVYLSGANEFESPRPRGGQTRFHQIDGSQGTAQQCYPELYYLLKEEGKSFINLKRINLCPGGKRSGR
jgi:hypothetical protein